MELLAWLIPLLLAVTILVLVGRALLASKRSGQTLICETCGAQTDAPRSKVKGSFAIEVVLWLAFIIPGFTYSLWRSTTRQKVCPACGSAMLIPINIPAGRKLTERFSKRKNEAGV